MALTEEEKQKIIEEEELRAKTRQKIQNEYEKENEYSTDWYFYLFFGLTILPLGHIQICIINISL